MSNSEDELPPPEVPEPERTGLEDTLRRFVMGLNYDGAHEIPEIPDSYTLWMELDGNLVIRYRMTDPDIPYGIAAYVVERKTKGRGKHSRPWWIVIRLSDEEELPEMKPYKPVDTWW